jgi:hypothetical protein
MPITGYPSTVSALPGERVYFHLCSDPPGNHTLTIERVGAGAALFTARGIAIGNHALPADRAGTYAWPPVALSPAFQVPGDWPSGLYLLRADGEAVLDFAVRARVPGSASRILLCADHITPQAYLNGDVAGAGMYASPRAARVSFDRPLAPLVNDGRFSPLIPWLRDNGYTVECASTVDLHRRAQLLDPYECLLIGPHVEYWSRAMRDAVERFVDRGGNLVSLSGNTAYRQVRFDTSRSMVCYKNSHADPHPELPETTVAFAQPPVHRPPNTMLGVGWTYGAWGGNAQAYTVHFPGHWVFAGLGQAIPTFMTYETDAAPFVMEEEGYPRVTTAEGNPLATTVLASAEMHDWAKPGLATMTLTVRHGAVFSASSTDWIAHLNHPAIGTITRNVLNRLRTRLPFGWAEVGHANNITAMTAWENRLYASDASKVLWSRHPVLADARWRRIGHANDVTAMAADRGALYAVSQGNHLWWRWPRDSEADWAFIGQGAPGGTRALCASGGTLYAVASDGSLHHRPATRTASHAWQPVPSLPATPSITALASHHGVLYAATSTHRLLRTSFDFVQESVHWVDIHACPGARGLAVVDGMLFMADSDNRLHWLDLRHRDMDALSGA